MTTPQIEHAHIEHLVTDVANPPYDIVRVAHVELLVRDLDLAARFYVEVLGLIESDRTDEVVYLRGWEEQVHHSLVLRRADVAAVGHVAFRVREPGDLALLAKACEESGTPAHWYADEPHHGQALRVTDPFGVPIEFFCEIDAVDSRLRDFHQQRGAPLMRLDHVNFQVPDIGRAIPFWTGHGFRCSEYLATDGPGEQLCGAWLFRKPHVHDIAFTVGAGPRLHHTAFWVADQTAVLRACDQIASSGEALRIERGPGRHGISSAFFVYIRDPEGHRIELFSTDYYTGDPDLKPLRWSAADPTARTFWGTRAPDSWYEEASYLIGEDGEPLALAEGAVDERSELLA